MPPKLDMDTELLVPTDQPDTHPHRYHEPPTPPSLPPSPLPRPSIPDAVFSPPKSLPSSPLLRPPVPDPVIPPPPPLPLVSSPSQIIIKQGPLPPQSFPQNTHIALQLAPSLRPSLSRDRGVILHTAQQLGFSDTSLLVDDHSSEYYFPDLSIPTILPPGDSYTELGHADTLLPSSDDTERARSVLDMHNPHDIQENGNLLFGGSRPSVFKTKVIPTKEENEDNIFQQTRFDEFSCLLHKVVFVFVPRSRADGPCIYTSRIVDKIQEYGTPRSRQKSRFVLCEPCEVEHGLITHAPTVQCCSFRLVISLNTEQNGCKVAEKDITQAFAQAKTKLQRPIFANAPPFMKLGLDTILMFIYPLYGLLDSGVHWLFRYHGHHRKRLSSRAAAYDYCFIYIPSYHGNITSDEHTSKIPSQSTGSSVTFNDKNIAIAYDD